MISQREARRLRKRVSELETILNNERKVWGYEFRYAVEVARAKWEPFDFVPVAIRTARKLRHAVVVTADDDGTVRMHALPLADID